MYDTTPIIDPVENAPSGDAFYTPPSPLPDGPPGDPVYVRRLDNPAAALKEGSNWLVLYRSQDVRGGEVATSGIIVLPNHNEHPVPPGGYPLISWAHGTVGVANKVAPSRDRGDTGASPMNAYPNDLLNRFLGRGWAVAMTDYEALGTGTADHIHPYLLGASEANGVLDIVLAARRLFPGVIGEKFVIVGHSQGGQAALFAAHHAPERVEHGLVGVAAIAPSNHSLPLVQAGAEEDKTGDGFAFTPLFLAGAIGGNPEIDPAQVLSDQALELWPHILDRSRAELSDNESWGGIKGSAQFRGTYPEDPNPHQQLFDDQLAKMNPDVEIRVPVRITQAAGDLRVFAALPDPLKGTDVLVDELNETNKEHGIAKSKPTEHDLPFSTWSLTKLADFLVAEGVVDDISHEGLRILLREEGVSFQRLKTWKTSRDPDYAAKKARVEHLHAIADGEVIPEDGEPEVVFCLDEFGPLNLMPHPGKQWAERGGKHKDPDREPRRRRRATYNRYGGVRHLFAAYDLARDKLYGHIKPIKRRTQFLEFCRYLRTLYSAHVRIAIVCDNFSPHLTTKKFQRVGDWAAANNVEIAYTPTNSSWLNRIEAQFTALRYFTLDGTDHATHKEQGSMIRRYIIWRNRHVEDRRLRAVVDRANVA